MAIVCREARLTDLDDINILFQSLVRDSDALSNRQEIIYRRLLKEDLVDLIVVEQDEYVVGCCHVAVVPTLAHNGRSYAMINHLVIDPLNRRQGLARKLIQSVIERARKKGCYQVYLAADPAKNWHAKFLAPLGLKPLMGMFGLEERK